MPSVPIGWGAYAGSGVAVNRRCRPGSAPRFRPDMSRLDSFIHRLCAQRACLDRAVRLIDGIAGPVLEIGLGNGRTYDHLRHRLPDRSIFAFDRVIATHPDCLPPADRLILGELATTLPSASVRIGAPAALAHVDVGSGVPERDDPVCRLLDRFLPPLMAAGGVIVSDQPLDAAALEHMELPRDVAEGRYFMYRASALPSQGSF
jgi:S-adenosyl-L-methionine methyltransferase